MKIFHSLFCETVIDNSTVIDFIKQTPNPLYLWFYVFHYITYHLASWH